MSFRQFCISPEILGQYEKLLELIFQCIVFFQLRRESPKKHWNFVLHGTQFKWFLGPSPCNWRLMIHWNMVLTILHDYQIYRGSWKIVLNAFQCIVVLQWRGDWLKKAWNHDLRVQHMQQTNMGQLTVLALYAFHETSTVSWLLLVHCMLSKKLDQFCTVYLNGIFCVPLRHFC